MKMIRIAGTICMSIFFGCATTHQAPVNTPEAQKATRSIPADMKVITCQSSTMGAIIVRIDISEQISIDRPSLINAIRKRAAQEGQEKCAHRPVPTIVVINHGSQRLVAVTHNGVNWQDVREGAYRIDESQAPAPPFQQTIPEPAIPPIQASVITRTIAGFTLGMPLENALEAAINGLQARRIMPLDSQTSWQGFANTFRKNNLFSRKYVGGNSIVSEGYRSLGERNVIVSSIAPFSTADAQKVVLWFYQDKLYEIAVKFRNDVDALGQAFMTKYGQPTRTEGLQRYPSAVVWEDAFTTLTLYVNAYRGDGAVYHDKTIDPNYRHHELPRNY